MAPIHAVVREAKCWLQPRRRTGEGPEPQLQADAEQQQDHADIGDELDALARLLAEGMKHEAGGEIAHQGRQPDDRRREPERERHQHEVRSIVSPPSAVQSARVLT